MTFSDREQLRGMDFEKMSLEELARAKAASCACGCGAGRPDRRFAPDRHGAPRRFARDLARRTALGGLIELKRRSPRRRPPPLVVLCDILGSMSRYSASFCISCIRSPTTATASTLRLRNPAANINPLIALSRCRSGARARRRGGRRLVGGATAVKAKQPATRAVQAGHSCAACPGRGRAVGDQQPIGPCPQAARAQP